MESYDMTNLRPDSPRGESERDYILRQIREKEGELGGVECVLTFEYHFAGGFRFNRRPLGEAEQMLCPGAPRVIKYWKKEQFMSKPRGVDIGEVTGRLYDTQVPHRSLP